MSKNSIFQATPVAKLEEEIMSANVPKSEREWWAQREIERLREQLAAAGNSQSQDARVAELEAEVDALRSAAEELAKIWDECECEDEGIDDIGVTIRHDFARFLEQEKLIAAMGKQEGGAE